jgi:hypothetical protein
MAEKQSKVLQAWDKAGWALSPAGWLGYKVFKKVTESESEKVARGAKKMVKSMKERCVDHGTVTVESHHKATASW